MSTNQFPMTSQMLRNLKINWNLELETKAREFAKQEARRISNEIVKVAKEGKTQIVIPNTHRTVYICQYNGGSISTSHQDGPNMDVLPLTIANLQEMFPDAVIQYNAIDNNRGHLIIDWSK